MAKQKGSGRVFWRSRGGVPRAYGDFRDYADVGGKQEALIPRDEKRATSDPDTAQVLVSTRVRELDDARRGRALHGERKRAALGDFASDHLLAKAKAGRVTRPWLATREQQLKAAIAFLGTHRDLESIRVSDVKAWAHHLTENGAVSGRRLSPGSVRHYLFALSDLFGTAQEEEVVPPGYNPVAAWRSKPRIVNREARWLESDEAALVLEAARTLPAIPNNPDALGSDIALPLIAAFLLTGGRRAEVLGLAVDDVSFDRRTVTFRPQPWRRLKTSTSARVVPLWPQLEEVLRSYVFGREAAPRHLLFPSSGLDGDRPLVEIRKLLDRIAVRTGFGVGKLRSRIFRHTYAASRLQTLDHGAPVSTFTVSRELGHGGEALVRRVYGHLGQVRHRSEMLEYPVSLCDARLADRLAALEAR